MLVFRAGIVRQLIRQRFRTRPRSAPGSIRLALVIGNPDALPAANLPPLPGAELESADVARLLAQRGYKVTHLHGADRLGDIVGGAASHDHVFERQPCLVDQQ